MCQTEFQLRIILHAEMIKEIARVNPLLWFSSQLLCREKMLNDQWVLDSCRVAKEEPPRVPPTSQPWELEAGHSAISHTVTV